jgi:hypothetical protein
MAMSNDGGNNIKWVIGAVLVAANETIQVLFHTDEIARTQADAAGGFANVTATIPTSYSVFAPKQYDIIAIGLSSAKSATTPFTTSG